MPDPYDGHRPVLPVQNSNTWVHNYTGKVGVYSNWFLMSSTHLLEDAPLRDHRPGDGYMPNDIQMSRWFRGLQKDTPMEFAKYAHGGQKVPYMRFAQWEFHGVDSAEAFPRYTPAQPAVLVGPGPVPETMDWTNAGENFTFTIEVDDYSPGTWDDNDTSYTRQEFIDSVNLALGDVNAVASLNEDNHLVITTDSVGVESSIEITAVTDDLTTNILEVAGPVTGAAAEGTQWGHDGTRVISTSRWSNWIFRGLEKAKALRDVGNAPREWNTAIAYIGPSKPWEFQGVGDQAIEGANRTLADKHDEAYGFGRVNEWFGVASAKAL